MTSRRESRDFAALAIAPGSLEPMEAKAAATLPGGEGWQFEPKWDGFRCVAFKDGSAVALQAKSGKPLTRYFPEVAAHLGKMDVKTCVLDGELMIPSVASFDFDALGQRIHPAASRIARLSSETPALYVAFDLLVTDRGRDLRGTPLRERRRRLERFCDAHADDVGLSLAPATQDRAVAERWLGEAAAAFDGVVAKRLDDGYRCGERAMVKVKRKRTADCVVGGFRYATGRREVGSLLLGLYDGDRLFHVGFTSNLPHDGRAALTRQLESIAGGAGFDENVPGKPSRWARERSAEWTKLRPELVVEVAFDKVTARKLRHGSAFLRWRPDKAPRQCTFAQIEGIIGGVT